MLTAGQDFDSYSVVWCTVDADVQSNLWCAVNADVQSDFWRAVNADIQSNLWRAVNVDVQSKLWHAVNADVQSTLWHAGFDMQSVLTCNQTVGVQSMLTCNQKDWSAISTLTCNQTRLWRRASSRGNSRRMTSLGWSGERHTGAGGSSRPGLLLGCPRDRGTRVRGHVGGSGGRTDRLGQRAGEVLPGRLWQHVGASAQIFVVPIDVETRVTAAVHLVTLDSETRLEDVTEHHLMQWTRRVMHGHRRVRLRTVQKKRSRQFPVNKRAESAA